MLTVEWLSNFWGNFNYHCGCFLYVNKILNTQSQVYICSFYHLQCKLFVEIVFFLMMSKYRINIKIIFNFNDSYFLFHVYAISRFFIGLQ